MIVSASCPTAVLSISFFPYRLGDSRKSACGVVAAFLFLRQDFRGPQMGRSVKESRHDRSRDRGLPRTGRDRRFHHPAHPKSLTQDRRMLRRPRRRLQLPRASGSGNRLVPQISAQFKRSVHLFSHGELDPGPMNESDSWHRHGSPALQVT